MQFDFTAIFQAILALLGAIITYWLIPYIKSKATAQQQEYVAVLVRTAVAAAEQLYGAGMGSAKLDYAQQWLNERGIKYSRAEIEAAVRELSSDIVSVLNAANDEANKSGGDKSGGD